MSKNAIPGLKTGAGALTKAISIAVSIAVLVMVVKFPGDAATFVKQAFDLFGEVITGLVTFIRTLGK